MVSHTYMICCLSFSGLVMSAPARAEVIGITSIDSHPESSQPSGWDLANPPKVAPSPEPISGPPLPESPPPAESDRRCASFGSQVGAVKWEVAALTGYITALHLDSVIANYRSFHFQDEDWFGKSTKNLGVDKLAHSYNAYLITEFLHARISRKTKGAKGGALTAAVLAMGLVTYGEIYDGLKDDSGFSKEDMISNLAGAGFSVLRNTVPGLKEKLDFRLLLIPNSDIYTFTGKRHYAQQRFMLALQLAGFEQLEESPLRFVELHGGYYAKDFTARALARGETPKRKIFFGIGLNFQELFFKNPRSTAGRVANRVLDYIQIPYTAAHWD